MKKELILNVIPPEVWKGDILFTLSPAPEVSAPGFPGKDAGDVRVLESEGQTGGKNNLRVQVSMGPQAKINLESIRRSGAAISNWLVKNGVENAALDMKGLESIDFPGARQALLEGLLLGAFRFDRFKTGLANQAEIRLDILAQDANPVRQDIDQMTTVASAVNLAREWGHEPPNVINPVSLASRAVQFASENSLKCTVFDEKQLREMGAGALYSVGIGSKTPSRLIVLEYPGAGVSPQDRPVALVGKAITFDTGGYSLKDRNGMLGMKYDKCGGMAVLGVLQAAAGLKLAVPLVGLIAAAENMVSENSYRPDDIITTLSGKTVEVVSADAEGRLVLCDALTYAQTHYHPRALIDLATLTGGMVTALGYLRAGFMSNDDNLSGALIASGERTHELLWRFPLDDEYFDLIKGDDSDMKNSGPRVATPIIGAIFLKQFVAGDIPWAHLDIAGVADTEKDLPYCPSGATGFGVRLLLDYLQHLEQPA
ncbi:MAG: leucyl aminopeptidase family protein [Omnitrophica WOR_2 bacterium]